MDLLNYATDPVKEVEGTEVPVDAETTLVIARYNNRPFRKMQNRLMSVAATTTREGDIPLDAAEAILTKCMAKHILLGWKGLKIEGEIIPYSYEKALELLGDPRLQNFKELVLRNSQNQEYFKLSTLREELGNSVRSLSTTQDGIESKDVSSMT